MTATPAPTSRSTPTIFPTPPCPSDGTQTGNSLRYEVDVTIDAAERVARAQLRAMYQNDSGVALDRLVFHVDPNRARKVFKLDTVTLEAPLTVGLAESMLDGPRLEVIFDQPLQPGCMVTVNMGFQISVPALQNARMKYLSHTDRQMNLGYWLPELAPYADGAWLIPTESPVGEYIVSRRADFVVRAALLSGPSQIIGPGEVARLDARTWRFVLRDGRAFPLVISPAMESLSATTADGLTVEVHHFRKQGELARDAAGKPIDAAQYALEVAVRAAEYFTLYFGPPPYSRLVIVEGDFPDGMEFGGLVHVSTTWFVGYRGKPDSWLTLITAHEVAHQWWYARVMNDPAAAPFLDEALSIYAELLYLELGEPGLVSWWWGFRINLYQPVGDVDAPIYEFGTGRAYINAVYLRGAMMLHDIRVRIGDAAFFNWLTAYISTAKDRIATPLEFWGALSRLDYLAIADIRYKYLKIGDPLGLDAPTPSPEATASR